MAKETRFRGLSWESGTEGGKRPEPTSFLPKEGLGKEARPGAGPRGGSPQPGLRAPPRTFTAQAGLSQLIGQSP